MKSMEKDNIQFSRRKFIEQSTLAGAGLILLNPIQLFSQTNNKNNLKVNIQSKAYAGKDEKSKLEPWNFERRPVGDNDVLIEIKYSGICH